MASSPRCHRNRAIFWRFISTAHTISSWNGYWNLQTSGSSTSMSSSSSFFLFFFHFPLTGVSSSCRNRADQQLSLWWSEVLSAHNFYVPPCRAALKLWAVRQKFGEKFETLGGGLCLLGVYVCMYCKLVRSHAWRTTDFVRTFRLADTLKRSGWLRNLVLEWVISDDNV